MSPELRDWLLDCPALTGISTLALDAAACGLVDLNEELPRAVAADVRLRTSFVLYKRMASKVGIALARARKLRVCRVSVAGGTAVLSGPIAPGAVVAEADGKALVELDMLIPETLAAAMSGRPLFQLVSSPVLDVRPYVVTEATTGAVRTILRFDVPTVPIVRVRPGVPKVSRAF